MRGDSVFEKEHKLPHAFFAMRAGLAPAPSRNRHATTMRTQIQIICATIEESDKEQDYSKDHKAVGDIIVGEYLMKYHSNNCDSKSQALPYSHDSSFGGEIFSDDLF